MSRVLDKALVSATIFSKTSTYLSHLSILHVRYLSLCNCSQRLDVVLLCSRRHSTHAKFAQCRCCAARVDLHDADVVLLTLTTTEEYPPRPTLPKTHRILLILAGSRA
jgi:hypothetical protein